jgi:hypothetical protein
MTVLLVDNRLCDDNINYCLGDIFVTIKHSTTVRSSKVLVRWLKNQLDLKDGHMW